MLEPLELLHRWVELRKKKRHKYEVGYLLAIVGSATYVGAAVLAVQAAVRLGVGGVMVITPPAVKPFILYHVPEAIVWPLASASRHTEQ